MKTANIAGIKFNSLTAVKYLKSDKHRHAIWIFTCDCGKKVNALASTVKSGGKKSCGCVRRQAADLTGMVFGRLTAIKSVGRYRSGTCSTLIWFCSCACGNTSKVFSSNLKGKRTKSCGCHEAARDFEVRKKMQIGIDRAKRKKNIGSRGINGGMNITMTDEEYGENFRRLKGCYKRALKHGILFDADEYLKKLDLLTKQRAEQIGHWEEDRKLCTTHEQ